MTVSSAKIGERVSIEIDVLFTFGLHASKFFSLNQFWISSYWISLYFYDHIICKVY